ncbi:HAD family hydrolase [Streptococcus ruminantium]|nr:HAD family hydrolase [Streptococcus ruminantium]
MMEWIFFDLSSTLLDEEEAYSHYVKECVKRLQFLGRDGSFNFYCKKMEEFARGGGDPIKETWNYFAPNEKRPLWTNEGVRLYPVVKEVLEKLSSNYQLGIIANQSGGVRALLEDWGVLSYFQLIILSEEIGFTKPDPTIFKLALEKAATSADKTIYVGDRYDNDILPAKSLGMRAVRVMTGLGRLGVEDGKWKSDWQIDSLLELVAMIDSQRQSFEMNCSL